MSMLIKIVTLIFSVSLASFPDWLFELFVRKRLSNILKSKEYNIDDKVKRHRIIDLFKAHIGFVSFAASALAIIISLFLDFDIVEGEVVFSQARFFIRVIVLLILIAVIFFSFFKLLQNEQPAILQRITLYLSLVVLLLEIIGVI